MATKITSPKGFPEYLPKDQQKFDYLRNKIAETYASFGFYHIATPAVEYMKTLSSTGDVSKEIYAIKRAKGEGEENVNADNERGLRFDLTKPLARYTAEHFGDLHFPFKRYQIQPSWRGERPQKGRFRELYQADIDIIGLNTLSFGYDTEVVEVLATTLNALNIGTFRIRINNRKFLQGVMEHFGLPQDKLADGLRVVDKIDKIGNDAVKSHFENEFGFSEGVSEKLLEVLTLKIECENALKQLGTLDFQNLLFKEGKKELIDMFTQLQSLKFDNVEIVHDYSIARGLDYYTGFVFETNLVGYEDYGSVCSGGRYENLAGEFTNQKLPGVGGSIGLTRLFSLILDQNIDVSQVLLDKPASYLITYFEESKANEALEIARELRLQNNIVEVAPEPLKLDKALKYVVNKEMDYLVIIEENGSLTRKNLKTREQETFQDIKKMLS
jgi:histidyl-tRNA synthetase